MPGPIYNLPNTKVKGQTSFYWGLEETPATIINATTAVTVTAGTGTAGTVSTTPNFEPCRTSGITLMRLTYNDMENRNFAANSYGETETQHHAEIDLDLSYRAGGLLERCLAVMAGDITNTGAVETVAGTVAPYTHALKVGPNGTRQNTFTIWINDSDTSNTYECVYAVLDSLTFSGSPTAVVEAKAKFLAFWPTIVAVPATPTPVPVVNLIPSTRGVFTLQGSAGAYGFSPYNWGLTLARKVTPYESNSQGTQTDPLNPYDFETEPLTLEATIDTVFQGMATGTIVRDYMSLAKLGTSVAPHSINFTETSANHYGFTVSFWPAQWTTQPKLSETGGGWLKLAGGKLTSFQDAATATGATPAFTPVSAISLVSPTGTAFIA